MGKSRKMFFRVEGTVYPLSVLFSFGETDKELVKKLDRYNVHHKETEWGYFNKLTAAQYVIFTSGQSLVRMKKVPKTPEEFGFLVHEIFHVVEGVFEMIGIKHELTKSGEAYAYYIQYLTKQALENIKRLKKKKKK